MFNMDHEINKFHVVAVVSNPVRFLSRYNLFKRFQEHMKESGIPSSNFHVVELTYGQRHPEIAGHGYGTHHRYTCDQELWHKENLINLGISRLPPDWKYVAWIDGDIEFLRDDWLQETVQQLQHYQVVQMWQNAIDHGPNGETLQVHTSFMSAYLAGVAYRPGYGTYMHPGYCWAARREAITAVGGLIEHAVVGAGDHHMALCLVGMGDQSYPPGINPVYISRIMEWQERALYWIKKDVGFVSGTIRHFWHGKKADRRYQDRWKILKKYDFNPDTDLMKDWQGVLRFNNTHQPRMTGLRDAVRAYFRSRNEDSIDR